MQRKAQSGKWQIRLLFQLKVTSDKWPSSKWQMANTTSIPSTITTH